MSTKIASFDAIREPVEAGDSTGLRPQSPRKILWTSMLIFGSAFLLLFLGMPLRPTIYDEGLVLTGAMRVAAGQVPHRDFYTMYGPAEFYLIAGLFKLFGTSVLIERLLDLFFKAMVVASVFAVCASYLRKRIAAAASLIVLGYLFGVLFRYWGYPTIPASLFALVGTALLVPTVTRDVSKRRICTAGALTGIASLFRYDTGIALLAVHACLFAIASFVQSRKDWLQRFAINFGPYLAGLAIVVLPSALYYLSVAALHGLVTDLLLVAKYYAPGRGVPFPGIGWRSIDNLAIYLPLAAVALAAYSIFENRSKMASVRNFLIAFSLLTLAMYTKGLVRTGTLMMYLAILPSVLVTAALFQQRHGFRSFVRFAILLLAGLNLLSAGWCSLRALKIDYKERFSVPYVLWTSSRGTTPALQAAWCKTVNVSTRGLCFQPEADRIRVIEFLTSHTTPRQTLFLGLPRHDKIYLNDNFTYFATQRLPATGWSHLDPDVQTRPEIQAEMIHDLEGRPPPYVVLDSEFETMPAEPNDSSRSSGVKALDEYLHRKYSYLQSFGPMAIWQRIPDQ